MELETYRFRIGKFNCVSINDGYHDYKVEAFFDNIASEIVEGALRNRGDPTDRIPSTYGVLYIDTGNHKVLVDAGAGCLLPETGRLPAALLHENVDPADIDTLIVTHAHPDHIGGLVDDRNNSVFRNARIISWKREWDFWFSDDAIDKFGSEKVVDLIRQIHSGIESQLTFIEPESAVLPGITLIDARGHTPGHLVVQLESWDDRLLYISDTVFHPLHLEHPEWLSMPRYMIEPEQFVESRRRVFNLAAESKALVHAMHFSPFPCLGRVEKIGGSWHWQAIDTKAE